jgi:acyl-CoA reductase-like NAD-dependent aldehyde dehydrogenase
MSGFISCDPTTGQAIGRFPIPAPAEVAAAVACAHNEAERWREVAVADRCRRLRELHDRLAADADALAQIVTREIGKPLQESYGADLLPALSGLSWLADRAPRALRARGPSARGLSPEPYGVIGVIGTWNYPLLLDLAPIAWALAAGNAVVWKPSELAAATAGAAHLHLQRVGLPVTLIHGDGSTGRALCRAGVDKLAFTGSVATGRAILAELAAHGTPAVMELSGNDAMIVCADADIRLAARSAVWGRCANAGQSCIAPQRLYVDPTVYGRFLQECKEALDALRPGIDYGPLRTAAFRVRVHEAVRAAIAGGAKRLAGGCPPDDRPGFYYTPTLLADCTDEMEVVAQDLFGPVLPVCRVQSDEEAIRRANGCDLALGASVWTRDRARGRQIAARLRVGVVAINGDTLLTAADPALPFGGLRASGFGKQRGVAGLEEFVQWKVTVVSGTGGARRHLFPYRAATLPILRGLIALRAAHGPAAKLRAIRDLARAGRAWKQHRRDTEE